MKELLEQYQEINRQFSQMRQSAKRLEVGCKVTLANGEKQIISEIQHGMEAIGENLFFRWDAFFPYETEHAAMGDEYQIVDVKWN